jgi:hypothetical protein
MLVNLLNGFLRESENPYEEYPDLRPEELVADIMDWVSEGDTRLYGGSKDAFYASLNPPYKAKKGRLFTIDELRLVKGMDGRIFEKIKPYITVYSYDSKLNINAASETLYKAIYADFTDDDIKRIMEQRSKLGGWPNEKSFVDFVVQTLGRTGFSTLYPKPEEYPFTVGTESFLIESLGEVRKSASNIQRRIQVALAFTSAKGGTVLPGVTQADCAKSPKTQFWRADTQQCITNPRNGAECQLVLGTETAQGAQTVCVIRQTTPLPTLSIPMGGTATAGTPGTPAKKSAGANTMKILYWAES